MLFLYCDTCCIHAAYKCNGPLSVFDVQKVNNQSSQSLYPFWGPRQGSSLDEGPI